MPPIQSANNWTSNAELIADAYTLGYIGEYVLDLSYGRGVFWKTHRPTHLVTSDINPAIECDHHINVVEPLDLWFYDRFDTTVWDGPYRMSGKRDQGEFDQRYGLDEYMGNDDIMGLLIAGVNTAIEATKRGGTILVKCQNQVNGGRKRWQTRDLTTAAINKGCNLIDEFHMLGPQRPQPEGRRQLTSRSNYSTLLVFRKPAR